VVITKANAKVKENLFAKAKAKDLVSFC